MSASAGQRGKGAAEAGFGPAVVVHAAGQAAAALEIAAGRPLLLLSAPGAAGFLGPAGWLALVARAATAVPGTEFTAALCCGAAPGHALAALRAGCRCLVLEGDVPAFDMVASAAAECGAAVLSARPPALDLGTLDLRRAAARARLALWLTAP